MNHAHLTLRPWRLSDAAVLPGLIGDPAVQRNLRDGLPLPYTEEDARAFLAAMLAADPEEAFPFAIAWEDVAIGSLSLFRQGNIHRCAAELGYYLGRAYWGRGIMTWAVEAACQWAFAHTDLLRI